MTKSKRKLLSRRYRFSYIKYNNNQLIGYEQQENNWQDTFFNDIILYNYCWTRKMRPYSRLLNYGHEDYYDRISKVFTKNNRIHKKRTRHRIKELTRKEYQNFLFSVEDDYRIEENCTYCRWRFL